MKDSRFSFRERINSFAYAFRGMREFFAHDPNGKIEIGLALLAISFGFYFQISSTEWMFVVFSIITVIASEIFNTAIEEICNLIHPDKHPTIKRIKDLSAGAVLLIAIGAFVIGLIIFIPKFGNLF
ncbi:MAG: diacylglycerol kinase family protein [Saprospiraceae bacterium]|nr:diacylglycerol kinase family protein [Saprospiraceae bacterium]